ncbi:permease of phosphate ABC transporter, partial [Eisenbergiella porci]
MKCLFSYANEYVKESDWKDLALVKFCLCATGVMIGLCIPKEKKKVPLLIAGAVFTVTYIPL